ncbi:MAG TPA: ChaN family lipoprotein [Fimbriimonadaceae bacterium]|nr:ChaN family lipoprotein [Fimbriimonadaceae bacterium]
MPDKQGLFHGLTDDASVKMNVMVFAAFAVALQQPAIDPLRLPIGAPGEVVVAPGQIVSTRDGRSRSVRDVVRMAEPHRFVYLGESHTSAGHHRLQAEIVQALVQSGRDVIVGFEMFTRPNQKALNPFTLGWWSDEEFQEKADWKGQWGFDYQLYKPVFDVVRRHRLPMVALNIPRDWVRAVGRGGLEALTSEQRSELPSHIDLGNARHRQVFDGLMGGHPPTGAQGENIYAAQVLWDVAMADSALRYLASYPAGRKTVMVILAGSGHLMYGQGINWRIRQRTGEAGLTLVMIDTKAPRPVSRGLGDLIAATHPD